MPQNQYAIVAFSVGKPPRVVRYSGGVSRAKLKLAAQRLNEGGSRREWGTRYEVRFAVHVPRPGPLWRNELPPFQRPR
jgi:hypothetical protein